MRRNIWERFYWSWEVGDTSGDSSKAAHYINSIISLHSVRTCPLPRHHRAVYYRACNKLAAKCLPVSSAIQADSAVLRDKCSMSITFHVILCTFCLITLKTSIYWCDFYIIYGGILKCIPVFLIFNWISKDGVGGGFFMVKISLAITGVDNNAICKKFFFLKKLIYLHEIWEIKVTWLLINCAISHKVAHSTLLPTKLAHILQMTACWHGRRCPQKALVFQYYFASSDWF